MEKIYLLDRNALSEIKKSADGVNVDLKKLSKLKSLDKKGNFISGMLSVREGQSKRLETCEQIELSIEKDLPYLERFYKKARTDGGFFVENKEFTGKCFGHVEGKELNWDIYIKFIKYVQGILYQPVKRAKRLECARNIILESKSLGVPKGHLIVVCALASLYGNHSAIKILKSKPNMSKQEADEAAYNSLSDLICLTRVLYVQAHVGTNYFVKFLTFDIALSEFFKSLEINWFSPIDNGVDTGVSTNITFSKKLFLEIQDLEFEKLSHIITNT
ncbi:MULTISPECIES: hypothetical protein [Vibrio]|nr:MULTISPECIES: hypothetical protein [Vibrio]EKA7365957.1 hypothetical protein [Vibrio parahaemolyticus]KJQ85988.1 hypothetical protein UG53_15655 [Vibrio sp. S512-13]KJQ90548.1 hypothetical protein UF05_15360 [Vibrio sp. S457-15]MCS0191336.1 hypothetical protein [Vibrio parahaemolyticus]